MIPIYYIRKSNLWQRTYAAEWNSGEFYWSYSKSRGLEYNNREDAENDLRDIKDYYYKNFGLIKRLFVDIKIEVDLKP